MILHLDSFYRLNELTYWRLNAKAEYLSLGIITASIGAACRSISWYKLPLQTSSFIPSYTYVMGWFILRTESFIFQRGSIILRRGLFCSWHSIWFAIFACRCLRSLCTKLRCKMNTTFFLFGRDLSSLFPTSLRKTGKFHLRIGNIRPSQWIHTNDNNQLCEMTSVGSTWLIATVIGRREIKW